jgi:hypothetical protein
MKIRPRWEFQRRCIFCPDSMKPLFTSLSRFSFEFSIMCSLDWSRTQSSMVFNKRDKRHNNSCEHTKYYDDERFDFLRMPCIRLLPCRRRKIIAATNQNIVYLIKNCKLSELMSIDRPPAAAIAAVDPVLVHTHIPDDHTFKLCSTWYAIPANRVIVPLCCLVAVECVVVAGLPLVSAADGDAATSAAFGSSSWLSHPSRNRETAAGLGLEINRSFRAGTSRVSEKVDLTLQRILARRDRLSSSSPWTIRGSLSSRSNAVHMHNAP